MKKFLLLCAAVLCGTASWAEDTETIQLSTKVDNPENVYQLKNGNGRWMTSTSGPTETMFNVAQFAFFAGDGTVSEGQVSYKILCVTTGQWLTYTKAGSYENKVGFATFTDDQAAAQSWVGDIAEDGKDNTGKGITNGKVYQFRPFNNTGIAGKYMNWFQGPDSNPSDNTTITVGLWQDNAAADCGSCWLVSAVTMDEVKATYDAWKADMDTRVGTAFGQSSVDNAELTAGKNALDAATTWQAVGAAKEQCKVAYTDFDPVGKYIRIQNTKHSTYTSLDGYTLNMKNKAEDANDPSQIWKIEKIGERLYLKNVYAGLFPQGVPSGSSATTKIGTAQEKAFTYTQHAAATGENPAQWNIFFGGTQVNIEENGNVNYWYADGAHHYIYEVKTTEAELSEMCANYYKNNAKDDVEKPAKIEVDEAAEVIIQPSEFMDPRKINEAIDNINLAAADASQEKIWKMFNALTLWTANQGVQAYVNNANNNGGLKYVTYTTPAAEYGTIILPVNWSLPEGWTRYACSAKGEDNVLTLENKNGEGTNKNTPYIVQFGAEQQGKTYQFIGYGNGAGTANVTRGWLTGVLEESTTVPEGSYILSNYNDKLGFYKVAAGANYEAKQNRCYLTVPAAEARFEALFFDADTTTGISSVNAQTKQSGIYNIAGQRLSKLQKGLNIVNGKKIIVK
ncbi:MAG: hypothetical protein UHL07_00285 [Bacteroidaceae bacterium]|nr:hypothetical protein [Bacteroidaceae bacterium]